jgi:fermentation-respiration switch protein FrsA (DUF1100 family)
MSLPITRTLSVACLLAAVAGCSTTGQQSVNPQPLNPQLSSPQPSSPLTRMENSLIFVPTVYPVGNWQPAGVSFEDVWFTAADGTRLHGWYVPHENPRAVVLFAHGNGGNLSDRADLLPILRDDLRLTVMMFDYRGYGRSEGSADEQGVLQDARAARAWLAQRTGVAERDIVLMGRSLGAAVAVDLAASDGTRGLIIESTFTSLPDMAAKLAPLLPVRWLMHSRLDSLGKISDYHGPLLQSHGSGDRLIPYEQGQRLFAAANEPKQFVVIAGGDHNDPQTPEYYRAVDAFIDQLPQPRRHPDAPTHLPLAGLRRAARPGSAP